MCPAPQTIQRRYLRTDQEAVRRWKDGYWLVSDGYLVSDERERLSASSDLGLLDVGWRSLRPGLIPGLLSQPWPSEN